MLELHPAFDSEAAVAVAVAGIGFAAGLVEAESVVE